MAKKKIKLKKGSKINELSINSPEYRQLYESGTLASIDEEGVPNMYYPEVNVVGDAPLKLRKKRQLAKADYTDEELERYMYQGKRPDRDKDFLLPPGERLKIYNAVLPFEYPDKELPKALRRYITGEERKFLGQESIKEEDRDLGRTDEDAWAHFMGLPQLYNTVDKSEYLPTDSKSKNAEYYTIRKGYPDFDELLLENAHNWFQRKENTNANTLRGVGSPFMPLENVTYSKGQDERGKYYSMYDVYDFNVPYQKGIGKPYEVYDRVYYDDTNPDKPVVLKKSYGGKITNMKKKKSNNLPKMFGGTSSLGNQNPILGNMWGTKTLESATGPLAGTMKMLNGPLAPLMGMAMNSVTDMVHAINTPERERRPVLQNAASYTFDNGGTVGDKPRKKKKVKVNKKEYDVNSPEYRNIFEQGLMSVDADGLPVNYQGSDEAWNEYYESKRKKKGEDAVREGRAKFVKETAKLLPANPNETDSVVENVLEYVPLLGQVLSIDDAMLAAQDMYNGNKQGTFNNALDMIGVLPFGKAGNMLRIPSYIENAADAAGIYGVGSDIYQDNISPMLYPKTNNKSIPQNTNFATSEDEYRTGGTIKIKPSKKGTFTAAAKKHGKSVQAFASQVLANKDNYSPAMVKKANFARNAAKWKKAMGGVVEPEIFANGGLTGTYMDAFDAMAYGGTIDPSMYMQQLMYGSYATGGQVPQNIPVEVEGEEMYEMPNGQVGEFSGPKHENGGMPMALPEGTKIYSDRLKVNGKTMAARKDKREANIAKLEKLLTKNPNDKFIKEALKRQQETNALQEQGDMQQQEMANEQQAQEEMAMEEMLMGAAQQDMQEGMMMAMGGMIKRADGSYSKRGLWDNIRANAGSGKKPTKEMLKQEKKIRAAQKAYGGMVEYAGGGTIPTMFGNLASTVTGIDNLTRITDPIKKAFTTPEPITTPYDVMTNLLTGAMQNPGQLLGNPLVDYNSAMPDYISTKKGVVNLKDNPQGVVNPMFTSPSADGDVAVEPGSGKGNRFMNFLNNAADKTGDFFSGLFDKNGKPKKDKNTKNEYDLTEGDRTGMLGTSVGMYGPALMTMLNKMQTPPNTNFYSTFGQEALRTQEEAEGLAGISKDEAYRKNLMRANALRKQLANSARGVGDIRSGQLAAELAEQEGARGILTNYLQGMSQLKGQRAGLQQQIDQTRMGGEYQRDLADRQDVDQYYTNLAENVANASNMMQKQGRDLNVVQYNKDIMNLSKAYSKYGIYAVRDPRSGLLTLAHKGADGKITYLSEEEAEELAKQQSEKQPTVTTTTVEEPKQ